MTSGYFDWVSPVVPGPQRRTGEAASPLRTRVSPVSPVSPESCSEGADIGQFEGAGNDSEERKFWKVRLDGKALCTLFAPAGMTYKQAMATITKRWPEANLEVTRK